MKTNEFTSENVETNFSSSETSGDTASRHDSLSQGWVAMLLGGGLLLGATARRSLPLALAGGMLVYRGATGRWAFSELLGLSEPKTRRHPATSVPHQSGMRVERSIVIHKSPEEIYRFWRNLENLPRFMSQVVEVKQIDEKHSHWKVKLLAGVTYEWDAEMINEVPNEFLAWRSLEGSDVDHAGSVHFEPDPHEGTKVAVVMEYRPPAGKLGAEIARMFGQEPAQVIEKDLRRLKQLIETGEIPAVEGHRTAPGYSCY